MLIPGFTKRIFAPTLVASVLVLASILPGTAFALRITSSSDAALSGALVEDFDRYTPSYFTTQDFLTGTDGFSVTALANDLHIDASFCGSFGTTGSCLDTVSSANGANDDFDVVFTGPGVSAFGFDLNALDNDWTVETYDTNDVLLGTYTILSQSPALTGFARRGYFGATETAPIQYFTVRSAGSDRALIDNFAFNPTPIPEPSTAMLAGLGLLGLALVGRREAR